MPEQIRSARVKARLTQAELAARASTAQTTVAAYENGRKSPRIETLERIAGAMDNQLEVLIVPPASDENRDRPIESLSREERRSLWLNRAISARIQSDPRTAISLARRNLAILRRHASAKTRSWQKEWAAILDGPIDVLLATLCSTSAHASQLRQTSPFAGLLTPRERWTVYRSFAECDDARTA